MARATKWKNVNGVAYYAKSDYEGLYIDSSDDEKKGGAPFSEPRNFLPNPVPNMIVMKKKVDTFGVDLSIKDSSMMDTISNLKSESPGDTQNKHPNSKGAIFHATPLA